MLEGVFYEFSNKNKSVYNGYKEQNEFVRKLLRGRKRLVNLYTEKEIKEGIDNSMDAMIEVREMQRQIEKIIIMVRKRERQVKMEYYLDKQEKRAEFESVARDIIVAYRTNTGKKTTTVEEKKTLFRIYHKDFYKKETKVLGYFEDALDDLKDERNELLNLRNEIKDWHNILKKLIGG